MFNKGQVGLGLSHSGGRGITFYDVNGGRFLPSTMFTVEDGRIGCHMEVGIASIQEQDFLYYVRNHHFAGCVLRHQLL